MEHNYEKSWEDFVTILNLRLPAKDAWDELVKAYENENSSFGNSLRNIDVASDRKDTKAWIETVASTHTIGKDVLAIWIGICKLLYEERELYAVYLVGCDSYDKDDIDWATEPTYIPENRYYVLDGLNQLHDILKSKSGDDYSFLDWILPLAYCCFLIDDLIINELNADQLLLYRDELFVSCGHDSGDYINLTPISKS